MISDILIQRKIQYLVHFTHIDNLINILDRGILPITDPTFQGMTNDEKRFDGKPNCSCFSISFPNYKMFHYCHKQELNKWFILGIDPCILLEGNRNIFCCHTNAASGSGMFIKKLCAESLEDMFYNEKNCPKNGYRYRQNIPVNYTTDPQAEILIEGTIEPRYIKIIWIGIPYESNTLKTSSGQEILLRYDASLFTFRRDSLYWVKESDG